MNVIIFSKDRAAQLDLLLRSMPPILDTNILYTYSHSCFRAGYDKIMDEYEDSPAWFIFQGDFKNDILENMSWHDELTVFFTDDDVFINLRSLLVLISNDVLDDKDIACVSLRLNPNLPYCYTLNRPQKIPTMVNNTWNWQGADADYGYPMSLDGHIFRTSDILPLLKKLDYSNPNELEGQLARHPIARPKMICYDKSIIVNNPINRVQDTVKNRHGNITAEYLNEQFLAGKRIKLEPFIGIENSACHMEIPIEFE